ncbi:YlxM family DNA-binding protein [Eisenbergiella sp.]
MEKIVEQGLLYDFYGELLNEHQRRIYEDAVLNDMSLSEIAQEAGISRQGVHDLIKRCDKTLEDYESRLHLMEKFRNIAEKLEEIKQLAPDEKIRNLADEILAEM